MSDMFDHEEETRAMVRALSTGDLLRVYDNLRSSPADFWLCSVITSEITKRQKSIGAEEGSPQVA